MYHFGEGALFKSHPLYSVRPDALQIILYTGEIEISSANKLLMFYYTLGNIDPKFQSKLAAIRLRAIAKTTGVSQRRC